MTDTVIEPMVEWDLTRPCDDCPFRKSSAFHQGVAGALKDYFDSIHSNRFAHTCHKTDRRPTCDGPQTWDGAPKHCAGALITLLKTGRGFDLQLPLLHAMEAGKIDIHEWTARAKADRECFTVPELLAFYSRGLQRRVDSKARKVRRRERKKQRLSRKGVR